MGAGIPVSVMANELVLATLEGLEPHKTKILLGYGLGMHTGYYDQVNYETLTTLFDLYAPEWASGDDIDNVVDYIIENKDECVLAIVLALKGDTVKLRAAFVQALS